MSKFCKQCGNPLPPGATICDSCGAPVSSGTPNTPPASGINLANMSVFSWGILVASLVMVLSTFLPYVSALGFSQSLMKGGDGIFFIILAIVAILGALFQKPIVALVAGVLSALLAIFEVVHASSVIKSELGAWSGLVDNGIGLYLNVLSAIVLVIFAILVFLDAKNHH